MNRACRDTRPPLLRSYPKEPWLAYQQMPSVWRGIWCDTAAVEWKSRPPCCKRNVTTTSIPTWPLTGGHFFFLLTFTCASRFRVLKYSIGPTFSRKLSNPVDFFIRTRTVFDNQFDYIFVKLTFEVIARSFKRFCDFNFRKIMIQTGTDRQQKSGIVGRWSR